GEKHPANPHVCTYFDCYSVLKDRRHAMPLQAARAERVSIRRGAIGQDKSAVKDLSIRTHSGLKRTYSRSTL
ncbi:MAG: hypothetical protein AAFQ65_15950, partial [Myxococcota bacterium]